MVPAIGPPPLATAATSGALTTGPNDLAGAALTPELHAGLVDEARNHAGGRPRLPARRVQGKEAVAGDGRRHGFDERATFTPAAESRGLRATRSSRTEKPS